VLTFGPRDGIIVKQSRDTAKQTERNTERRVKRPARLDETSGLEALRKRDGELRGTTERTLKIKQRRDKNNP